MSPQKRNVIVGLTVMLGLAALVWMLLTFSSNAISLFTRTGLEVVLTSDRADGLSPGSIVYYRGVSVGRVTFVRRLDDNEHVEIGLDLDQKPPLPGNLVGLIRTNSALGSTAAITLDVIGPPSKEPLKSGAQLLAKYVGLELIPPEFTELAGQFRQQQLVLHLDQAVISIRDQANKAGNILDSLDKLVSDPKIQEQVHQAIANLHDASESAAQVTAKFNKLSDKVDTVVDNTNTHIGEISQQIGTDTDKLGKILDKFNETAQSLNEKKGTAGLLVNDPKLYNSLVDTVQTLNATVADLKRLIAQWEQEGVPLKMGK
jgi:phospholipid/cholesterol/gamma-HCH transport system substrate-binding protein